MTTREEREYGTTRRPEHAELPGHPRKKLVRDTRGVLWRYLRARPQRHDRCWRLAWQWAAACASHNHCLRKHAWPNGNEIASQYLLLVLSDMKQCFALRLPFHAAEALPEAVAQALGTRKMPALMQPAPQRLTGPTDKPTSTPGGKPPATPRKTAPRKAAAADPQPPRLF
jgi:hypothetical protein